LLFYLSTFPSKTMTAANSKTWMQVFKDHVPSRLVFVSLITRLLLYGNIRVLYPLKNFIAEDWGLTSAEMNNILAAGELSSIGAGIVGSLGDVYGNRIIALGSWAMTVIFTCIVLCPPSLELDMIARIISSLFATVFIVVSQSAVVAETDPRQMGFVTGISESGWGFSILALVPILTVIYEHAGWRAMWSTLCALMVPLCFELWFKFPEDDRISKQKICHNKTEIQVIEQGENIAPSRESSECNIVIQDSTKVGISNSKMELALMKLKTSSYRAVFMPGPLMFNLSSMILNIGHNLMFLAFTNWASIYHYVDAESMGVASFGIGAAELAGIMCVVCFSSRLGLLNTIYIAGTSFAVAIGMFILAADHSFSAGVAVAAILFLPGESMIVSQIALAEIYVPQHQRTTMLAMNFQFHFLGRAIGAFVAEPIWSKGEVLSSGLLGVSAAVVAVLLQFFSSCYIPKAMGVDSSVEHLNNAKIGEDNKNVSAELSGEIHTNKVPIEQSQTMLDSASNSKMVVV